MDDSFEHDEDDEWSIFQIYGIAMSLPEAVKIAQKVEKSKKVTLEDLRIEEVPVGTALMPRSKKLDPFFLVQGAVAMYDIDGTAMRKVLENNVVFLNGTKA